MKSSLLAFSLICSALCCRAQISISSSDFPGTGSNYRISLADTLIGLDPEPSGPDFVWDFSFLQPVTQSAENWVSPLATDILYFLLFGSSNLAQPLSVPEIPGIELADAYNFYQKSSGAFSQTGLAGKFTGIPIVIPFDNADRIFSFPLNFGDEEEDESVFELIVPTLLELREERMRQSEVDGWGTLITPFGSFDVLRHKSTIDIRDTLSGTLGNFAVERRTVEYRWLGEGSGIPLLQIDVQESSGFTVISRIAYQDSLRNNEPVPTGWMPTVAGAAQNSSFRLYPNPAGAEVWLSAHLAFAGRLNLELFDQSGRQLRAWTFDPLRADEHQLKLEINNLNPGLYWLQVQHQSSSAPGLEERSMLPLFLR